MPHDELRFHLLNRIHGDAHYDEKRRTTKLEIQVETVEKPLRQVRVEPAAAKQVG